MARTGPRAAGATTPPAPLVEDPAQACAAGDPHPGRGAGRLGAWAARLWPLLLLAALYAGGVLGLALVSRLAARAPLLLVALRPTWSILLLVGGSVPVVPALLVAVPLRALVDLAWFGVARNDLRSLLALRPGGQRVVDVLSRRSTERALLWFCILNTNPAVDAALGSSDVSWARFTRFLLPGTVLSTTAYLLAARAVSSWARDLVTWLDAHATEGFLVLVALAAARAGIGALRRRWKARRTT